MSTFHSFRVFLVESNQQNLFSDSDFSKEDLFRGVFERVREETKLEFRYRKTRYIIYFLESFTPDIYLFMLAREKTTKKPEEGDDRIKEVEDKQFPYIYFVLDMKRQIVLIEYKSSVFQDTKTPKNIIEEFITNQIQNEDLIIKIKTISSGYDFWETIDRSEAIYELKLELNGPNFFRGRFSANELVKELNQEYNTTESVFSFKNLRGRLKVLRENVQDYIKLITAGGGSYSLDYANENGQRDKMTEEEHPIKKSYEDIENVDIDKLETDLEDVDKSSEE